MRVTGFAVVLLGIAATSLNGQPAPSFEVASVKVVGGRTGTAGMFAMDTDPAMVRYSNITLQHLIAMAYRFDSRLIRGGPAWLDEQCYDLAAKLPSGTSKDRVPEMLQALLTERFRLAVHSETKQERVYFLLVGKSGPKLKNARTVDDTDVRQERGERPTVQIMRGAIIGNPMSLGVLAGVLAHAAGYEVMDRTGLTGTFEIRLKWSPDDSQGTDLFAAIQQQLGLRLEAGKGPVETLVVDHAERIPIEN
jgi:uncharacterized protein (TIGR03435 family)